MKYRVNEIFESVQAEGSQAGRAAVFVRFAGCNLACPFCDTNHEPFSEMTTAEIEAKVLALDPKRNHLVVFTGGEPTIQLREDEPLLQAWATAMETNGELPPPHWFEGLVTVSPKRELSPEWLVFADDVKCLMGTVSPDYLIRLEEEMNPFKGLFLQPLERNGEYNIDACVRWVCTHPRWRLSVQWHKLTGVK